MTHEVDHTCEGESTPGRVQPENHGMKEKVLSWSQNRLTLYANLTIIS